MSIDNNKSGTEEVPKDQTKAPEVGKKGPITEDDAISDILDTGSKDQKKDEPAGDDDKGDDGKSKETKPEDAGTFEPIKIGEQEFKTAKDLVEFAKKQIGYNTFIIGALKKARPDLFKADGSLDTKKMQEGVKDAVETIKKDNDESEDDVDPKEVEKAKNLLRKLGVVFNDDPDFVSAHTYAQQADQQAIEKARETIDSFIKEHPMLDDETHRDGVAAIMENMKVDLPKAWEMYKAGNSLKEELPTKDDTKTKNPSDTVLPVGVKRESGSKPSSGQNKDFMDDLLSTPGM